MSAGAARSIAVVTAKTGVRAAQSLLTDGGPHYAASISFRVLFSLFPLAIVLGAVFGIVVHATGVRADVVDSRALVTPFSPAGRESTATRPALETTASSP